MANNTSLKVLEVPSLEIVSNYFASKSQVEKFSANNLKRVGGWFMVDNTSLKTLEVPSLEIVDYSFAGNCQVEEFTAPNLKKVEHGFMENNKHLKRLNVPGDVDLGVNLSNDDENMKAHK